MDFDTLEKKLIDSLVPSKVKIPTYKQIYQIPKLHRELIDDTANQYLIIKGGRGGFKTTSFICAMIEYSYSYKSCAFLFTREVAKSINDSVYAVVVDLIAQAELSADFDIQKTNITNLKTGVKFLFTGLRATGGKTAMSQINKVKGLHKIRMVFMEEGQDLSEDSLNVLLPTANRKGTVKLVKQHKLNADSSAEKEIQEARFFVAMNPNKEVDPVVSKFKPYVEKGKGTISHINMMDIADSEPDMRDDNLVNQMELERDQPYFDHVWNGAPFHKFAGLPFSEHNLVSVDKAALTVYYAFVDPSFKGGDYTSVAFLGEVDGQAVAFGRAYKQAWNMSPTIDDIVALINSYAPTRSWFEDNSLGTVPMTEFAKYGIKVIGHTNVLNKEDRIYKAAAYTKDILSIAENLCDQTWLTLVTDYSDDAEFDDPPDSLASVIIKSGIIAEKIKF